MSRPVICLMFIGHNRTGKSVTAQHYANKWRIANPEGMIAGYDPQNRFKHLIDDRFKLSLGEKGWWSGNKTRSARKRLPLARLRNALFICDDMRGLNPSHQTMPDLVRLMEFRSEYCIDIIMVVHKPRFIIEGVNGYFSHIYVFYIKARLDEFEKKVDDSEECIAAGQVLKDYVDQFPSIMTNPKQFFDKTMQGNHTFPHVIVDTNTGALTPQNIDEEWLKTNLSKLT